MPLPLALMPLIALLVALGLFFLLRWWVRKTGAALLFTLSLLLNFALLSPLALVILLAQEALDLQAKLPTAPKLFLVEKGPDVLLAVSFTEVKDLEQGFSYFKPLTKEQIARLTQLGDARHQVLTKDYYKVLVVKRELLEKLAGPVSLSSPGQAVPGDPAALLNLLSSARDAFMSGDLDRVARVAAEMQKAFRERGMNEGADLARQIEQAARARDMRALETLGPRLAQFAIPGAGGPAPPGGAGPPLMPIPGDVLLRAIDAEDPAKALAQYVPPQAIQEMGGGNPAELKLMLIVLLFQTRFQAEFDPLFLLSEYKRGNIQIYPDTTISTMVKLLPIGPGQMNSNR